jgi:hypothetical protein
MFKRLARTLQPYGLQKVQWRYASVAEKESQQMTLRDMAERRHGGHGPVAFWRGADRILHSMHRRVHVPAVGKKW